MRILELRSMDQKLFYLPLLRCADPSDEMILRYLHRGRVFVLEEEDPLDDAKRDGQALAAAVLVDLGDGTCELKNLSVAPGKRRQGYGRMLIEHAAAVCEETHTTMLAGVCKTSVPVFERCGFCFSHTADGYYKANYPDLLRKNPDLGPDLYYLRRSLRPVLSIHGRRRGRALRKNKWAAQAKAL